ncbi:MAG: hypothetical protein J6J13_03540, partial [Clostridia bacterium]|nr:hypothetical protein [Clostridia bacterium]
IDYVRVYKDKNGYDESDRLTEFERFIKDLADSLTVFGQRIISFFQHLCAQCYQFFERLFGMIPALYRTTNSNL